MNVLNITYKDFGKGKWELASGMYEQQKINGYIDLYTNKLLAQLLGVEMYNLFVANLDCSSFAKALVFSRFESALPTTTRPTMPKI